MAKTQGRVALRFVLKQSHSVMFVGDTCAQASYIYSVIWTSQLLFHRNNVYRQVLNATQCFDTSKKSMRSATDLSYWTNRSIGALSFHELFVLTFLALAFFAFLTSFFVFAFLTFVFAFLPFAFFPLLSFS